TDTANRRSRWGRGAAPARAAARPRRGSPRSGSPPVRARRSRIVPGARSGEGGCRSCGDVASSGLRLGRRQLVGLALRLEAYLVVAAVAEGLVGRLAAPAKRDDRAAIEPIRLAGLVGDDDVVPLDAVGAVVAHDDFCLGHARILLESPPPNSEGPRAQSAPTRPRSPGRPPERSFAAGRMGVARRDARA